MEKNLEVAVHSIKTFHEQQKKLYDEFVRLRMKYDRCVTFVLVLYEYREIESTPFEDLFLPFCFFVLLLSRLSCFFQYFFFLHPLLAFHWFTGFKCRCLSVGNLTNLLEPRVLFCLFGTIGKNGEHVPCFGNTFLRIVMGLGCFRGFLMSQRTKIVWINMC